MKCVKEYEIHALLTGTTVHLVDEKGQRGTARLFKVTIVTLYTKHSLQPW